MTNLTRRNFILGSVGLMGTLAITGCSSEPEVKYAVGDTVETDLVKLEVRRAEFTIALTDAMSLPTSSLNTWYFVSGEASGENYGDDMTYFTPKEYDETLDANNPNVAPKGSVFVYAELAFTNLDRTEIEVDNGNNEEFATLQYDDATYRIDIFDPPSKCYGLVAYESGLWQTLDDLDDDEVLLEPGEKKIYRAYYCYHVEPENLSDPFEITFQLPKSDDTTEFFTFAVNQ